MKLAAFIICEDIRSELGNKNSIIGVLNEGIFYTGGDAEVWPKMTNLSAFIRIIFEEQDIRPNNFTLEVSLEGEEIASVKGGFTLADQTKLLNIPVTMYGFPLKGEGNLDFVFQAFRQEDKVFECTETLTVSSEPQTKTTTER